MQADKREMAKPDGMIGRNPASRSPCTSDMVRQLQMLQEAKAEIDLLRANAALRQE